MALSTYSDLQSAIANWLARAGDAALTAAAPDFITLAETRLNRDLRLRAMETRDSAFAISAAYTALPSGFLGLRSIRLNTTPAAALEAMAPEQMDRAHAGWQSGRPRAYAIVANQLRLAPTPDAAYSADIVYWKAFTALSAGQPSNWLLSNAPDLYLYASLMEAVAFTGNDERLPLWAAAYERARAAMQAADDHGTWGGPAARVRAERNP